MPISHIASAPRRPAGAATPLALLAAFVTLPRRMVQARRRRIAQAELCTLSDHLLADIGLTRGDLDRRDS